MCLGREEAGLGQTKWFFNFSQVSNQDPSLLDQRRPNSHSLVREMLGLRSARHSVVPLVFLRSASRYSKDSHLRNAPGAKFLRDVGANDISTQKSVFSLSERLAYNELFGNLDDMQKLNSKRHRRRNWGRYAQSHETPEFIELHSPQHKHSTFDHISEEVVRVPYPQTGIQNATMRAMQELTEHSGYFVVVNIAEGMDEAVRKQAVDMYSRACLAYNIKLLLIKPVLLRACLWQLSSPSKQLDEFWTKGHLDFYTDKLCSKLTSAAPPTPKDRSTRGLTAVLFFDLGKGSHGVLENAIEPIQDVSKVIGARINSESIGGPENFQEILSNINTPWAAAGDEKTKTLAKVLESMASFGLVDSSKAPGGGIYVV